MPEQLHWDFPTEQTAVGKEGIHSGTGTIFESSPYVSLAREAIQNSLDARDNGNALEAGEQLPVTVEISFDYVPLAELPNFLEIKAHFEGIQGEPQSKEEEYRNSLLASLPQEGKKTIPALKIRDCGTIGMDYSSNIINSKEPALNAFLATGVNSKESGQANGGSRGWGKGVFFELSPLRTVLVSTYSKKDNKEYFIGKVSFCHHIVDGTLYRHFGVYSDCGQFATSDIPERFKRKNVGYGTDIYVMGTTGDDKKTREAIIKSIIQNYWCAIVNNELKVVLKGNKELRDCTIDKDSIDGLIAGQDSVYKLNFKNLDVASTKLTKFEPKPYYEAYVYAEKSEEEEGKKHYEGDDGREFFRFTKDLNTLGPSKFYLVKNPEIGKSKIAYMRKTHMTIFNETCSILSQGFYGLFICDNIPGDRFLTNMEGPAHDEWSADIAANQSKGDPERAKAEALKALDEIDAFINSCINEVFDLSNIDSMAIPGMNIGFEVNPAGTANNSEEDGSKGSGRWAILGVKAKTPKITDQPQPKVKLETTVVKDDDGPYSGGREHDGPGPNPGPDPRPGDRSKYKDSPEGKKLATTKSFKADIRLYPEVVDGKNYNVILLKAHENISSGIIKVDVATEAETMTVDISECYVEGKPHRIDGTTLRDLKLEQDKTVKISLLFEDNMIHTLRIGTESKENS